MRHIILYVCRERHVYVGVSRDRTLEYRASALCSAVFYSLFCTRLTDAFWTATSRGYAQNPVVDYDSNDFHKRKC